MARICRQGGQTVLVFTDAEMEALQSAAIAFDLEPALRENWTSGQDAAWERAANAIIPKRK